MSSSFYTCRICRCPAPAVEGWVGEIPGYRLVPTQWPDDGPFLDGALHFSCLRDSAERFDFARDFRAAVVGGHEVLTVEIAGRTEELTRTGLGYAEEVFSGVTCRIYRSAVSDRWMVLEDDGPWFGVGPKQLKAIRLGEPVLSSGDEVRYALPAEPGTAVDRWQLADLFDFLGVRHRYGDLLESRDVTYEFLGYHAPKRILSYSVVNPIPLPEESVTFLRTYAAEYTPIRFPE